MRDKQITFPKTRRYLGNVQRLKMLIQRTSGDIFSLRTNATNITVALGEERIQTSSPKDRMAGTIAKIVDEERRLESLNNKFLEERKKLIDQISALDEEDAVLSTVLYCKYVDGMSLESISEIVDYSMRHTIRLHEEALGLFDIKYHDLIYKDGK